MAGPDDHQVHEVLVGGARRLRLAAGVVAAVVAVVVAVAGVVLVARSGGAPLPPASAASALPTGSTLTVYFLGDTPDGVRLYPEPEPALPGRVQALDQSLAALTTAPHDPDRRTLWPPGAFGGVRVVDDTVEVVVADPSLVGAPALDGPDAQESVQQVVFTVQAAVGRELPVRFTYQGTTAPRILGIRTGQLFTRGPEPEVLAPVGISDPTDGSDAQGGFSADGTALGAVSWSLVPTAGPDAGQTVASGRAPVTGATAEHLGSWHTGRLSGDWAAGTYVFTARCHGAADTRTVHIR